MINPLRRYSLSELAELSREGVPTPSEKLSRFRFLRRVLQRCTHHDRLNLRHCVLEHIGFTGQ